MPDLLAEGYRYLDVRSRSEFAQGHVPGALNVPLLIERLEGSVQDEQFLEKVSKLFEKEERIIVGCQSGQRSKLALALLVAAGFAELSEMGAGFGGVRDAFGRLTPGWLQCRLPIETGSDADSE